MLYVLLCKVLVLNRLGQFRMALEEPEQFQEMGN